MDRLCPVCKIILSSILFFFTVSILIMEIKDCWLNLNLTGKQDSKISSLADDENSKLKNLCNVFMCLFWISNIRFDLHCEYHSGIQVGKRGPGSKLVSQWTHSGSQNTCLGSGVEWPAHLLQSWDWPPPQRHVQWQIQWARSGPLPGSDGPNCMERGPAGTRSRKWSRRSEQAQPQDQVEYLIRFIRTGSGGSWRWYRGWGKLCWFQRRKSWRPSISSELSCCSVLREKYSSALGEVPDRLSPAEFVHWYLGPERRNPKGAGVSGAHRNGHTADQGSLWEQGGPVWAVVGPCKLVEEALRWHHIPDKCRDLSLDYYNSAIEIFRSCCHHSAEVRHAAHLLELLEFSWNSPSPGRTALNG